MEGAASSVSAPPATNAVTTALVRVRDRGRGWDRGIIREEGESEGRRGGSGGSLVSP